LAYRKWNIWKEQASNKLFRFLFRLAEQGKITLPKNMETVHRTNFYAFWNYVPRFYAGKLILFRAAERSRKSPDNGWNNFCGKVEIHQAEGKHATMLKEPYVRALAQDLSACLEKARA
jgi:thioesterase domain-containing protein